MILYKAFILRYYPASPIALSTSLMLSGTLAPTFQPYLWHSIYSHFYKHYRMDINWNDVYLQNTVRDWATSLGIAAAFIIAVWIFKALLLGRLKKWATHTRTDIDDFIIRLVERSLLPVFYVIGIYLGTKVLNIPKTVQNILNIAILMVITFFILRLITSVVDYFISRYLHKRDRGGTKEKQARGLIIIINVVVWVIGLVFFIDNLGYDVTTVIAGLGIGGVAIALAAQAILGDLFSYFVIFFDRPFEIGDAILVDEKTGTIEYIGIKTTHIDRLSGEQLIFSNSDLTNSRIHNFKRQESRRVAFTLGVTYQTPHQMLQRIPEMIRSVIDSVDKVRFDRAHLAALADSSINYEVVYYVLSSDYNLYMDLQQQILLGILKSFESEEISLAFPTRTIYLRAEDDATQLQENTQ